MEDNIGSINNNKNMNQTSHNKKENRKISISQKYSKLINFILFEIISISLPKTIFSQNYINYTIIKVNKIGYNQIISDYYTGDLPSKVLINDNFGLPILMRNKKVYIESINMPIYLEWTSNDNINFSYMFCNLTSITSVIINILAINQNMSHMFYNCKNLENFVYNKIEITNKKSSFFFNSNNINNNNNNRIIDMTSMFYNCYSLKSFDFKNFSLDYDGRIPFSTYYNNIFKQNITIYNYTYYNLSLSYMFYNCKSLTSINFGSVDVGEVIDMKGMFYNCFSLKSLNLSRILTNNQIVDLSYMFYNCSGLESIIRDRNALDAGGENSNDIYAKDIQYMFYNCTSISQIELKYFKSKDYINAYKLFYNCYKLESLEGNFSGLQINDTREMFCNCISLSSLTFNPDGINNYTNMTKMFYNCINLENVILNGSNYFFPIDLSYAFYNCSSLKSLIFTFFNTDYLEEIKYMMFNCSNLTDFNLDNSVFSNLLIKNMRGVFQNCESITSLDLTSFSTPQVEIMWDMFKGCSKLEFLIQNFSTSNVVDMESMFEGCSNLVSLNLSNFKTTNVHYMNKMFSNCLNLKELDIRYITSEELGTMHQMFYNCKSLEYLNIFSLTEKAQSIIDMFEGASDNFTFCVKESETIPKIFKELLLRPNTTRDCSIDCYGYKRVTVPKNKLCCPFYEYNSQCYDKCPPRTTPAANKSCVPLPCTNSYYDYNQTGCIDKVPDGYYVNDTSLNTIDKCPETCVTCEKKPNKNRVHCLSCYESLPFLYFGECRNSCDHGFYNNLGTLICLCITKECSDCSEESLENDKCITCAEGYYPKIIEKNEPFKKCYQNPPKYYLNSISQFYENCFDSCQYCFGKGNKESHNCISCDSNHTFAIEHNETGIVKKNCYIKCPYHYYFDNEYNYFCSKIKECPRDSYPYLIVKLGQCVESCKDTDYKKKLKYECYKECPEGISKENTLIPDLCDTICPYDAPFELNETCVGSCSIMERSEMLCKTNNIGNRTNLQIQEIIHDDIISDLTNRFNYSIITDNYSVIINETKTMYEIISTKNKNKNSITSNIDFGNCESMLKDYYEIDKNEPLYVLKMDADVEGKMGPTVVYELFYPLENGGKLDQLDISICEGEKISISYSLELENPELYDKNNPIYSDICHPYTSEDGLDMTLSSKQQDYANNNKSLCEENCEYIGYDKLDKLVKCNCDIKDGSTVISDIKVDKSKLYDFMGIDKLANFDVLKCVNLIIQKEYLLGNIGFYTFVPSFICYFVAVIVFYAKDFEIIKIKINNFVIAKKNLEYLRKQKKKMLEDELNKKNKYVEPVFLSFMKKKKIKKKPIILDSNIYKVENDKLITNEKESSTKLKQNDTIEEKITEEDIPQDNSAVRLRHPNNTIINVNNIHNDIVIIKKTSNNAPPPKTSGSNKLEKNDINIYSKKKGTNNLTEKMVFRNANVDFNTKMAQIEKEENKMKLLFKKNDKELNELSFKAAVKYDDRTFWKLYFSFLKAEHLLVRIINKRDYNSVVVKIYLFLYNAGLSYTVNGLFFDDEAIEEIFAEGGQFNFINQLPQIIYSSIITFVLFAILDYLALTEDKVLDIKRGKVVKIVEKKANDTIRTLQIKYAFFFILSFVFLLACWYYMTCFCAVYRNTQFHLLKDTLISFGISMLTPFAAKLIPAIFRIYGLRKRSHIFYRISEFTQMLL